MSENNEFTTVSKEESQPEVVAENNAAQTEVPQQPIAEKQEAVQEPVAQEEVKEPITPNPTPEGSIVLSPEALREMISFAVEQGQKGAKETISAIREDFTAALAQAGLGASPNSRLLGARRIYDASEIDVDDYLDSPVIFFTYSHSYTCHDDFRYGKVVRTPYGNPIKFKHLYRYVKNNPQSRFDTRIVTMSAATIRSKKEAQWLRDHSLFGIKFFENRSSAESIDITYSDVMVDVMNQLNQMSQFEVVERAKRDPDVTVETTDPEILKRALASVMAKRRIQQDSVRADNKAKELAREAETLQNIKQDIASGQSVQKEVAY